MKHRARKHRFGDLWKNFSSAFNTLHQFDTIEERLDRLQGQLEHLSATPLWGAVYMGNNRVLVRYMVENRVIAYLVEADDLLLTPWFIVSGQYETEVAKFFVDNLRPDSRCLDIGANFGFYTCLMARFCPAGKVIGIEPVDTVYKLLRDNIFINGLNRHAAAIKAAVAQGPGRLTLHRRIPRSANTSIAKPTEALLQYHGEGGFERFETETVSVDGMLAQFDNRIDFMKIDVEGAEPLVLRGAVETIRLNPQLQIVMEWSPHQIRDVGFDVGEFISELCSLHLSAAIIRPFGFEQLPLPALLNIEYAAGILLSDDHRH
jgi:FkbM family methyltransferase